MPRYKKIGEVRSATLGSVPIVGLDEIDIGREQDWDVSSSGLQSSVVAVWKGSQPVEYPVNFELLAGYGDVPSREVLYDKCRIWHAMGAHQLDNQGHAIAPPRVQLLIYSVVDQVGFFKNVRTNMMGPWGSSKGDVQFALPTVVRFSGTFCFIPGYDIAAAQAGVSINQNNKNLAATNVRNVFYTFKG